MTPACQFRRGFFTLRTCDRPAMKQCENCGQSACPFHLSVPSRMSVCVDCYSQQSQREGKAEHEDYDDNWVYSYRSSYYESGYRPFMYSGQDHRSFDSSADEIDNYDDDYAGGDFSDS